MGEEQEGNENCDDEGKLENNRLADPFRCGLPGARVLGRSKARTASLRSSVGPMLVQIQPDCPVD